MSGGYFVTGTDTGIGKTVVSACLLRALHQHGRKAIYMKPVQTGCEERGGNRIAPDPEFVAASTGIQGTAQDQDAICPYRLLMPASPHLAARQEKVEIDLARIMRAYARLQARYDKLVVEGAGGVWVPLNSRESMLDLMTRINLPVVVACRSGLGTINHTLMTLQALRHRGLTVAGLVLVDTHNEPRGEIEADNRRTLEQWGRAPVLGWISYQTRIAEGAPDPDFIARQADALAFDKEGRGASAATGQKIRMTKYPSSKETRSPKLEMHRLYLR